MHYIFRDIDDISLLLYEGALLIGRDMGHSYSTTDLVLGAYGDNLHPVNGLIKSNIISLKTFAENEFIEIQNLHSKFRSSLSIADCSVIFCAMSTKGILITNEKILYNIGEMHNIKISSPKLYFQNVKLNKTG